MATIYLIRHGQAQFGMEDYDALSPNGIEQAKLLGKSLLQRGIIPTKIISGAMKRHQQTMQYCLENMQLQQLPAHMMEEWNEFDHRDVLNKYEPRYTDLNELKKDIFLDSNPKAKITEVLTGAITRWVSGQQQDYNESWVDFSARILSGLNKVKDASAKDDTVLVFTSGGSISVVMQHILELPLQKTFELQLNIANCSVTKIKTSSLGWRLLTFSDHAHFTGENSKWLTYK